jgi:hypothetical protein
MIEVIYLIFLLEALTVGALIYFWKNIRVRILKKVIKYLPTILTPVYKTMRWLFGY